MGITMSLFIVGFCDFGKANYQKKVAAKFALKINFLSVDMLEVFDGKTK